MKILYKQPADGADPFSPLGLDRCYFKHLSVEQDTRRITTRSHHHTGVEIHIIENGHQTYAVGGQPHTVNQGEYLLIPPTLSHRILASDPHASKFSITFNAADPRLTDRLTCRLGSTDKRLWEVIHLIVNEAGKRRRFSDALIGGWVLECIIRLLREAGIEEEAVAPYEDTVDPRYQMAVQYIRDNIEQAPSADEAARYCHLSEKQLSRLFLAADGCTVAQHIRAQRAYRAEQLLTDSHLTVKEISERMNFSDEAYFNAFFKKHAGMTPGKYRRMQQ